MDQQQKILSNFYFVISDLFHFISLQNKEWKFDNLLFVII
jgi:hypothetical protein